MNIRQVEDHGNTDPVIRWVPIKNVLEILKRSMDVTAQIRSGDENVDISHSWSWSKNSRCKYIELRVDMRNGRCTIRDRYGQPLSLEDLRYQGNQDEPS